jgi:nucleoid-associated protein YgaU
MHPSSRIVQGLSRPVGMTLVCAALLAACAETPTAGGGPTVAPAPQPAPQPANNGRPGAQPAPQYTATPGLTARQRVRKGIELLAEGRAEEARVEIQAFLMEQPDNELGRSLLEQIDGDPVAQLGAQSFPYKVQSGETLSALAERFLGDRFKFWALARYNNIPVPARMEVGQQLMIPGVPRGASAQPRRRQSDEAVIEQRIDPARPAPGSQTRAPTRDRARASQLRGNALELMGGGAIAQAVRLLEQALQLDPGNNLIIRDLDRARRLLRAP